MIVTNSGHISKKNLVTILFCLIIASSFKEKLLKRKQWIRKREEW